MPGSIRFSSAWLKPNLCCIKVSNMQEKGPTSFRMVPHRPVWPGTKMKLSASDFGLLGFGAQSWHQRINGTSCTTCRIHQCWTRYRLAKEGREIREQISGEHIHFLHHPLWLARLVHSSPSAGSIGSSESLVFVTSASFSCCLIFASVASSFSSFSPSPSSSIVSWKSS